MDPEMQQFLAAQMQLLQNMSTNMASMQAQINQNHPHKDKHQKFMSHFPSVFSHAVDPLEADDWLKTVEKMLTIT
jgi:hypothetical protein